MTPAISARGTAIHNPSCPINNGNSKIEPAKNKNVLAIEIMADTLPSEKAVNMADAKILKPINKKLVAKIGNPSFVIWNNFVLLSVNTPNAGSKTIKEMI